MISLELEYSKGAIFAELYISRYSAPLTELGFDSFGAMSGDQVLMRAGTGEVMEFELGYANAELTDDGTYNSVIGIQMPGWYLDEVTSSGVELRYRIVSSNAEIAPYESTIVADVLRYYKNFFKRCAAR